MINAQEFSNHPISHWESHYFIRDQDYRVNIPFVDADGTPQVFGEEWTFVGSKFSKFEDEYTLCVRFRSGEIRLLHCDPRRVSRMM